MKLETNESISPDNDKFIKQDDIDRGNYELAPEEEAKILAEQEEAEKQAIEENYKRKFASASADDIAAVIKNNESAGNYKERGASGENGAYQFMPETWAQWASEYKKAMEQEKGEEIPLPDIENASDQDAIAIFKIQQFLDQGLSARQIASKWNSGSTKWEGKVGVNSKGVAYDVPAYVEKFSNVLEKRLESKAEKQREQDIEDVRQLIESINTEEVEVGASKE